MLTKTQIKELAKKHGFYLKKSLGQNFLIDRNIRDKIMRLSGLGGDDIVLEIGPGLGALTEPLAGRCRRVYAVEKDKKIYSLSKEILSGYKNLDIIHGDFLKFDISALGGGISAVGALPYYITSPIIQHLFSHKKSLKEILIIVQKEVARRLTAKENSRDYSSLSLFVQFYSGIDTLMDIKRTAFFPVPDVDSALLRLGILPRPKAEVKDEGTLFKVIRASFGQRRKTILSSLSHKEILGLKKDEIAHILKSLGIDDKIRAEVLSLEEFANIADAIIDFSS